MKDRALKNVIAALLGLAIGLLILMAVGIERCQAAPVAGEFERVKYANALQRDFQRSGYEIWTAAYGPEKSSLFIKSPEFVDPDVVSSFIKDTLVEFEAFGFVDVMLSTGEVNMVLNIKKASDIAKKKEVM